MDLREIPHVKMMPTSKEMKGNIITWVQILELSNNLNKFQVYAEDWTVASSSCFEYVSC